MVHASYKQSTITSYYKANEKFSQFLTAYGASFSLPVPPYFIAMYISYLGALNTPTCSIRTNINALAWHHRINGFPDPTQLLPIKRQIAGNDLFQKSRDALHPLDRALLHTICDLISSTLPDLFMQKLLKSVLLLMYHACMRVGEAVHSGSSEHSLKRENVSVTSDCPPSLLITLNSFKHSKAPKTFRLLPLPSPPYCPVNALVEYLKARPDINGVLYVDALGKPIKRTLIADTIKKYVALAGYDPNNFNTHSIRVGRTSDLAKQGVPLAIIKETGRWRSEAYTKYIRFPSFTLPH